MLTSKKHFIYYSKRVRYWANKLNLNNYSLKIVHEYISIDGDTCKGGCNRDKAARHAIIFLGKDWGSDTISNYELNKTALHECLELFLFDIVSMISTRFMDAANIEPERHNIIQTLIKNLLKEK